MEGNFKNKLQIPLDDIKHVEEGLSKKMVRIIMKGGYNTRFWGFRIVTHKKTLEFSSNLEKGRILWVSGM